jgi:23S rRNA pseudouridine1911/1915/1917 synthase
MPPLDLLYEDNHLLVVNKPAGLATQGAADGEPSLVTLAQEYLRVKYNKPGNVYIGVVSRLDALVTGAVVLARTSKAAARLSEQFRLGSPHKTYWALVAGAPQPSAGECVDWLYKDEAAHRMVAVSSPRTSAQETRLTYRTLQSLAEATLLEIELQTGRKHQIRVQLSRRGWPILGDRKYGSDRSFPRGIALHSRQLRLTHPVRDETLTFDAPLPAYWPKL